MTADQLRQKYLAFFQSKGHVIIPGASLIPENDPSVLFTTAGMHPLVPYLMGESHPAGTRLCDVQRCVRTGDIDEVGDASHCTFFEMLGNWSLGDYFKKEAISWSYEFLTGQQYLNIPPEKLAFSVFAGDADAPRDEESAGYWMAQGVPAERIFFLPKKNNWWYAGATGPCGPDTEMFIDTGKPACSPECSPACDCGKYLEIWNDVFMQFYRNAEGQFEPLKQKNVDTGMGLERTITVLQGKKSVYETDIFAALIKKLESLSGKLYGQEATLKQFRIAADHLRTGVFMLGDERGVLPSNVDQGYVLRRLIRRAVRVGLQLGLPKGWLAQAAEVVINQYKQVYPILEARREHIITELNREEERFLHTLTQGLKEFEKYAARAQSKQIGTVDGETAFHLYDTFGFPVEMTCELAAERGMTVDTDGFAEWFRAHQEKSQAGAAQKFKGGLADQSEQTTRLHTATHLLHAALRRVLGGEVAQRGSNITPERLRFDFSFGRKMTEEEVREVERLVNAAITANAPIQCEEMPLEQAKETGAIGLFESKYGEQVKVYSMGGFSKEICGGPHAKNTGELGGFIIQKEESSSSGVRRIKATITAQE